MKILLLSNSRVAAPIAEFLSHQTELIQNDGPIDCEYFRSERPDLIVSYSYRHIIRAEVLKCHPGRFVNLHIALLPYNRGADPNPWSFIENTPKGVTMHVMDAGIDTGPIIAQRQVFFDESRETLGHSYEVLQGCMQDLFFERWTCLLDRTFRAAEQTHAGTFHTAREFAAIKNSLLGPEGWDVPIPLFKERFHYLRLHQLSNS